MRRVDIVDLYEKFAASAERTGVIWTLRQRSDLNVNLVRFPIGEGVGEHINEEVDVLFVGVSGSGVVAVEGHEHPLQAGTIAFVPRGVCRSTRSDAGDFAYLTVHHQRGPLRIGNPLG